MRDTQTTAALRPATILPARLARKILVTPTGCWRWTGRLNYKGYATAKVASLPGGERFGRSNVILHRYVYDLLVGPVPDGLTLDHTCHRHDECEGGDTCPHRACLNPNHLEPVTSAENTFRGNSWAGKHARQTHCLAGHLFDETNTVIRSDGRECLQCKRRRGRDYWRKKAAGRRGEVAQAAADRVNGDSNVVAFSSDPVGAE